MHILKKPIPACLSVAAFAGITKPTIFASALKLIANIPGYIKAYEEIKNSLNDHPPKAVVVDENTPINQDMEEMKNG